MSRKNSIRLLPIIAAFLFGTPAMALNPQPLPPRVAPSFNAPMNSGGAPTRAFAPQSRWDNSILHCRPVQVGDPRKQAPMKVCP